MATRRAALIGISCLVLLSGAAKCDSPRDHRGPHPSHSQSLLAGLAPTDLGHGCIGWRWDETEPVYTALCPSVSS